MINGRLLNNLRLQKGLSIDDVADALNFRRLPSIVGSAKMR